MSAVPNMGEQSLAYAEGALLGALLLDNARLHDVASLVSADKFTSADHKALYAIIRDRVLSGDSADTVTVGEANPDLFGLAMQLAANTPGVSGVKTYAKTVHENWRMRQAVAIALRLASEARNGEPGAVDSALGALLGLNATATECEYTGKQAMRLAWNEAQTAFENKGQLPGITTGLRALDEILGGWHDSDLTIIGARPAMGKTALMGSLAEAAAEAGSRPGIFSAEQPVVQLALRRLSAESGVGAAHIRAGKFEDEDWPLLQSGMARAVNRDMWIYDRSAVTLDELIAIARKWKHSHNIGVLFIDYAQRITVPGVDRISEVSQVARGLKNLARDLQLPVVALAQVIKGVDTRENKRPTMGDLANSDELTREADQILMLYRDVVYNPESAPGVAEILIEKNRHGPIGFRKVAFLEKTMRFADLAREEF